MHCCCCCCCSWSCCRWSLGHDLAAKKQCPLSVDPGMVKKPAPGKRAGARGFAGRARGPSAPGVRGNGRVMHRRPRRWTPTAFPGGSSPATGRKSHKKAKTFKVIIGSISCLCLEACDCRAFAARVTNRHGHWACWTSACWMSMGGKNCFKHTASISVEHVVEMTAKRRLFQVCLLYTSPSPRD